MTLNLNTSPALEIQKVEQQTVLFPKKEYQVGNVTVHDHTNQIAQLVLDEFQPDSSEKKEELYKIIINGRHVVSPACMSDPFIGIYSDEIDLPPAEYSFHFKAPQKISLRFDGVFIRVHEENTRGMITRFIDLTRVVKKIFHPIFYQKPALEPKTFEAKTKAFQLKFRNPHLELCDVVYNRHGCAAWGWDNGKSKYCFFKASTNYESLIEDFNAIKFISKFTQEFLSSDRTIHYVYFSKIDPQIYLNGEPAFRLHFLPSSFFHQKAMEIN